MTNHRTSADYYAGIPQYAGRISPADLNAAKAAAWDEGFDAGELDYLTHKTFDEPCIANPYREVS
jgi:hypothetical protein